MFISLWHSQPGSRHLPHPRTILHHQAWPPPRLPLPSSPARGAGCARNSHHSVTLPRKASAAATAVPGLTPTRPAPADGRAHGDSDHGPRGSQETGAGGRCPSQHAHRRPGALSPVARALLSGRCAREADECHLLSRAEAPENRASPYGDILRRRCRADCSVAHRAGRLALRRRQGATALCGFHPGRAPLQSRVCPGMKLHRDVTLVLHPSFMSILCFWR